MALFIFVCALAPSVSGYLAIVMIVWLVACRNSQALNAKDTRKNQ